MQHLLPTPRLRGIPLYWPRQEGSDTFWKQNSAKVRLRGSVVWLESHLHRSRHFFFPLPVQNKWVWSLRTVSAIDFFIKQTFWLVIVGIVRVMMLSFHWSFPANHDREPAGTMARSSKKRKEKKPCGLQPCLLALLVTPFSTSVKFSEFLGLEMSGDISSYFSYNPKQTRITNFCGFAPMQILALRRSVCVELIYCRTGPTDKEWNCNPLRLTHTHTQTHAQKRQWTTT